MALQLTADTNEGLIKKLQICEIIKNEKVADVMKQTDRIHYCPATNPYIDRPEPIGLSAKISAPDIDALALETLVEFIKPDSMILDVGAGSGYLTTCFARLIETKAKEERVEPTGMVIGVDVQKNLLSFAEENIKKDDFGLIKNERVILFQGDGKIGCEEYAPYDIIYVGAAVTEAPNELLQQLKPGGHMICPVEDEDGQQLLILYKKKHSGEVIQKVLTHVLFDPMIITDQPKIDSIVAEDLASPDQGDLVDDDERTLKGIVENGKATFYGDADDDADSTKVNIGDGSNLSLNSQLYQKSEDLSNASTLSLKSFNL